MLFTKLNLSLVNTSYLKNISTEFLFLCYISYLKTIDGRYANYLKTIMKPLKTNSILMDGLKKLFTSTNTVLTIAYRVR